MIKKIAKELFEIKSHYPDDQFKIATKENARNFISKYPEYRITSLNNDDPAIIDAVKNLLNTNKSVLLVADADSGKYDVYAY